MFLEPDQAGSSYSTRPQKTNSIQSATLPGSMGEILDRVGVFQADHSGPPSGSKFLLDKVLGPE